MPGDTRPVYGWNDVAVPDVAAIDGTSRGPTLFSRRERTTTTFWVLLSPEKMSCGCHLHTCPCVDRTA